MSENIGLDVSVADFKKVCRVCLARCEKLTSIHKIVFTYGHSLEGTVEKLVLTDVLERYCHVKVRRNDAKPQNICEKCLNLLANAFNILSLFRLSNSRLDKILKKHSATMVKNPESNEESFSILFPESLNHDEIKDQNQLTIGKTSHVVYNNNSLQEVKLQDSKMHFEIELSKEGDDSIAIHESPLNVNARNTSKNKLIKGRVKNLTADQSNWIGWDHTYCVKPPEFSITVGKHIVKSKPRKPRIRLKKKEVISEQRLKKMLLQYQHKNEIFSCKLCEGHIFQGMDRVIDHMKTSHPLTDNCILCEKKISQIRMLPHVASHAKKRNLVCYKCSLYFKDKELLEAHYESEDHKNFTLNCQVCGKEFRRMFRLKMHVQEVHLNKGQHRTQCPKCGVLVKYKYNLEKHLRTHQEMKDRKLFLCEHCAQSFTTAAALKRHVLITHEGQVHLKKIKPKHPKEPEDPRFYKPDKKVYACDYCPRTISTKEAFFKHRISHPECRDVVCPVCQVMLPNLVVYQQHRQTLHSAYRCEYCYKGWPTKTALYMHKRQVHRTRNFKCPLCPMSFRTSQSLKGHKVTHSTEKPFPCQLCDKKFKQSSEVTQHMLCVHSEERRHKCHICSKSFVYHYHLRAHIRYHMGYRPFNCPYCTKGFTDTVSRHKHVKRYHPDKINDFLVFKQLHQSEEVRMVEGFPTGTEDCENEDYLAVLSLANESNVGSSNENKEELPKNADTMIDEYVFSPRGESVLNALLERN